MFSWLTKSSMEWKLEPKMWIYIPIYLTIYLSITLSIYLPVLELGHVLMVDEVHHGLEAGADVVYGHEHVAGPTLLKVALSKI